MKTIIAGSRAGVSYEEVVYAIHKAPWSISVVVSGTAKGVDKFGEYWAEQNNIPVDPYPADWDKYGRPHAGYIRNQQMADNAEALIAVWNGKSRGTLDMINRGHNNGLKVFVWDVSKPLNQFEMAFDRDEMPMEWFQ